MMAEALFHEGTDPVLHRSSCPCWSKAISFKKAIMWFQFRFTWCTTDSLTRASASHRAAQILRYFGSASRTLSLFEMLPLVLDSFQKLLEALLAANVLKERIALGEHGIIDEASIDCVLQPIHGLLPCSQAMPTMPQHYMTSQNPAYRLPRNPESSPGTLVSLSFSSPYFNKSPNLVSTLSGVALCTLINYGNSLFYPTRYTPTP